MTASVASPRTERRLPITSGHCSTIPCGCDPETWKGLADLGVLGLLDPTAGERDVVTAGVVLEELGRALLPEPYIASAVGAMVALEATDDPVLLADLATGARVAALAVHEPAQRYRWDNPTYRRDPGFGRLAIVRSKGVRTQRVPRPIASS